MKLCRKAERLVAEYGGGTYRFGPGALGHLGWFARELGRKALVVGNRGHLEDIFRVLERELAAHGVEIAGGAIVPGARANTPIGDAARIRDALLEQEPDLVVAVGGGSTIDAVKAAAAWAAVGGDLGCLFGTGEVSRALQAVGGQLVPMLAVQTAAGSGAHLTKYANVTLPETGQKKLIVDVAIVPARAVFDYDETRTVSVDVSVDGALDSMSHLLEVYYGIGVQGRPRAEQLVRVGLPLILRSAPRLAADPADSTVRTELGLAADLGAVAIMIGGTSGPHLTSFSLVNLTSHGRACAILSPYFTAFFAPAIEPQLRIVADIFAAHGRLDPSACRLSGRALGLAVAEAMLRFLASLQVPTSLKGLPGFDYAYIEQALAAAADPQLQMKLQNMPVPFSTEDVEKYMRPILMAAAEGDLTKVPL